MMSRVLSCATMGVDAYIVHIETDIQHQMPKFSLVGLPDSAVRESYDRVKAAIQNSGRLFPNHRITINMAPADIRKEGSAFSWAMLHARSPGGRSFRRNFPIVPARANLTWTHYHKQAKPADTPPKRGIMATQLVTGLVTTRHGSCDEP